MSRALLAGAFAGLAGFFILIVLGAAVVDMSATVHARDAGWLIASALVAAISGFAADRAALQAPAPRARYAAAIAGPAVIALAFALTSTAADQAARWAAPAVTVVAAALGAFVRESLGSAQRRH